MQRRADIIVFLSSQIWYLEKTVLFDGKKRYNRGDIIRLGNFKYLVLEDRARLRVRLFYEKINPYLPLLSQLERKAKRLPADLQRCDQAKKYASVSVCSSKPS